MFVLLTYIPSHQHVLLTYHHISMYFIFQTKRTGKGKVTRRDSHHPQTKIKINHEANEQSIRGIEFKKIFLLSSIIETNIIYGIHLPQVSDKHI